MKVDKYYDLCCYKCGAHRSTDYGKGMEFRTVSHIQLYGKQEGWKMIDGENVCPECVRKIKNVN